MDIILGQIQECRWSLGTFLKDLFADSEDGLGVSLKIFKRTHMVSRFLGGHTGVEVMKLGSGHARGAVTALMLATGMSGSA